MLSPPFPRYLVPPRSKYSPQHHILKHPQLPFLPPCQRPIFTPILSNRQNSTSILIFKFLDRRQKILHRMIASISWLQSALNIYIYIYEKIPATIVLQSGPSAWKATSQQLLNKFLFSRNSKSHHHTKNTNKPLIRCLISPLTLQTTSVKVIKYYRIINLQDSNQAPSL